jgi:hypothetical protein
MHPAGKRVSHALVHRGDEPLTLGQLVVRAGAAHDPIVDLKFGPVPATIKFRVNVIAMTITLRHRWAVATLAVCALATGCGSKAPSAANVKVCEQAAERYLRCVGETLGPEAQRQAASPDKNGIASCARSQRTVDWYQTKCLPTATCDEFISCTFDLATQQP